jgi:hypothetical protein
LAPSVSLINPDTEKLVARRARAAALPPEERRASILAATVPLLIAHGTQITTRQIGGRRRRQGTIFGLRRQGDADRSRCRAGIRSRPVEAELRHRLDAQPKRARGRGRHRPEAGGVAGRILAPGGANLPGVRFRRTRTGRRSAVATVFEPDRARLRMDPMEAADVLRGLTIASSHPALTVGEPKTPREIASVILDGIRTSTDAARTC